MNEIRLASTSTSTSTAAAGTSSAPALLTRTAVFMDTVVSITIRTVPPGLDALDGVERAFGWFGEVEARCSRFRPDSDIGRLAGRVDEPVPVGPLAFEALRFALALAEATDGVFDPTVGARLQAAGFDRNYQTGEHITSNLEASEGATFRDVELDVASRTVTCRRPLVLDLGAVAKGLAVDLAFEALGDFPDAVVNAGGDIRVRGRNPDGAPWMVGIRDPREPEEIIEILHVTDAAVCTSAGYERPNRAGDGAHLIDATTGLTPAGVVGVTVIASTAMLADALATASFLLGPDRAGSLLEEQGARGLFVLPEGDIAWRGIDAGTEIER